MSESTKVCVRKNHVMPITEFYKQSAAKDGLDPYCKECRKEVTRMYSVTNRASMSRYQREYYARNRERILQKRRESK